MMPTNAVSHFTFLGVTVTSNHDALICNAYEQRSRLQQLPSRFNLKALVGRTVFGVEVKEIEREP